DILYIVQSREYRLADIFTNKPNLGTYKFILKNNLIDENLRVHCDRDLKFYISKNIPDYINTVQDIRNETVHGSPPRFEDVKILREKIIGVACESMMIEIVKIRAKGFEAKEKRY
ncbi:MAG: ATP-binding protein, partial [Sulfurimonas sp.]|nr:ATP-binding protein [Sulfurimonas sp.]